MHSARQMSIPAAPIPFFTSTAVPNTTSVTPPMASPTPGIASAVRVTALLFTVSTAGLIIPCTTLNPSVHATSVFSSQDTMTSISSANLLRYSWDDRKSSTFTIIYTWMAGIRKYTITTSVR